MSNGPAKINQTLMSQMWLDGIRTGVIAAYFGCKSAAVSRCASTLGLPKRNVRGRLRDDPAPPPIKRNHQPAYLSKPDSDPSPERPPVRRTYDIVQSFVADGMTQRQALCRFHRGRG